MKTMNMQLFSVAFCELKSKLGGRSEVLVFEFQLILSGL